MTQKKAYQAPQLFRVELNPEQAILTQCSTMTMNTVAGFGSNTCRGTGTFPCKQGDMTFGVGDSGPRLS
ncbi:MAG: hypothetical protein KF814_03130 [Nitrospiraceae bacterium]|nr:hypothetical protein [Nitrospiraceae bacterium]